MPDGKIVAWDQANGEPYFDKVPTSGAAMVLDPATGDITRSVNLAPASLFCSLLTSLPDGRLAVIGGGIEQEANPSVQVFDADSRTFSVAGEMERSRYYPGGNLDAQGNVVVGGGTSKGIEFVDAQTGLGTLRDTTLPTNWYPDFIRMPDGSFTIENVGDLRPDSGAGPERYSFSGSGLTSIADKTLLQSRLRGVRTMIAPFKLFYNSGGLARDSMLIDVSSGVPSYSAAASSRFPHMTGTSVTLPTGDVLVVGGNSDGQPTTTEAPVMTPELYSVAKNSWTSMDNIARERVYHSVSALLPDGRVWSAGTSYLEMQEPNGQFFSPPYLFKHDGSGVLARRPTATDAPESVEEGKSFSIATDSPQDIKSAAFIRLAATTHQLNAGQAYVPLSVTPTGTGRVRMTAPEGAAAPPGYYMVFLIDSHGVPSIAPVVRLRPGASTALPVRATQSSQDGREWGASEAFDGAAGNADGAAGSVTRTESEDEPWWQVDLGQSRDLESVTVHLRTDCCAARDLWVFASDKPIMSTTVAGARGQPGLTAVHLQTPTGSAGVATLQRTARYIRVQSPNDADVLSLAEVVPNARGVPSPTPTSSPIASPSPTTNAPDTPPSTTAPTRTPAPTRPSAPYGDAVEADEPVSWWRFDERRGHRAADAIGRDPGRFQKGVKLGRPSLLATEPMGAAAAFSGEKDRVKVAAGALPVSPRAFSLEAWMNPRRLRSGAIAARAGAYALKLDGASVLFTVAGSALRVRTRPLLAGRTVHVVATFDGSRQRVFLDGKPVAARKLTSAPRSTRRPLRIGEGFRGALDEVALYDHALSPRRVAAHHEAGSLLR